MLETHQKSGPVKLTSNFCIGNIVGGPEWDGEWKDFWKLYGRVLDLMDENSRIEVLCADTLISISC